MTATPSIDLPAWMVEQLSQASPDLLRADGPDLRGSVNVSRCRRGLRRRLRAAQPGPQQHPQRLSASGWDTRAGSIDLAIPKLREATYFPEWLLERRRRAESALVSVVATSYLLGVSTRRMEKLVE